MGAFSFNEVPCIGYNEGYDGTDFENFGEYADFRDGAQGAVNNVYWENFSENSDVELDDDGVSANYKSGALTFGGPWEFNVSHLTGGNTTTADIFSDRSSAGDAFADLSFASIVTSRGANTGAHADHFEGWTWGDAIGALNSLK
jgi:hypothetical protein